ncbi:MAG: hypothetical protein ABIY48_07145, partial [Acidimicrobiales bacterium]
VEIFPRIDGRNMTMVLAPDKRAQAAAQKAAAAAAAEAADTTDEITTEEITTEEITTDETPAQAPVDAEQIDEALEADHVAEA